MEYFCTNTRLKNNDTQTAIPTWKRAIDVACCLLALPLLILCAVVMTIITKVASPGPVLFRQERVGFQGRRFKIYKFRSMHVNADTTSHQDYFKGLVRTNSPMVKLDAKGDARLIPGAWLLRASGLDELPQIINVLRGDMSIVGPRPCLPAEAALYQPWQHGRLAAAPGLTGLWQVSGKNRTTFDEMIRLDIRYAQNKSWWLDVKIILLTLPALVTQIYDTKMGRRSTAISQQTEPPFALTQSRAPVNGR
jgi:lipopolysaccharide/colanic/teichoic acid biosynthesis glycosyltransferase